jgi:hypothetical protein
MEGAGDHAFPRPQPINRRSIAMGRLANKVAIVTGASYDGGASITRT